ncbi:hypothetical protein DITRI_Ditri07aG0036300 [Diplodiscus trichospermus]
MSKRGETIIWWLLLVTCAAGLVQPGLALLIPQHGVIPYLPGLLPPVQGSPGHIQRCWLALTKFQRCVWDINGSGLRFDFSRIGPECCRAYKIINENCWPRNPFFPYFFLQRCARFEAAPPTAE